MTQPSIQEFQGPYRWLSNFWPAEVVLDGVVYPSVEHAYQAAKFPVDQRKAFRTGSAGDAKRMGRGRQIADKLQVMKKLLEDKFSEWNPSLMKQLIDTDDVVLLEGNRWHDTFWGVDLQTGVGLNHLGQLLMEVRSQLQAKRNKT